MWKNSTECSGLFEPDMHEDPSGWFDWWDGCITPEPEPEPSGPSEPPEPVCIPRQWVDAQNQCWRLICTDDGREIVPCWSSNPGWNVVPRVKAIKLHTDGYSVMVDIGGRGVAQRVTHGPIKLLHLVRAMVATSKLPARDVTTGPPSFWEQQPELTLKPVVRP
jgi:hypothetical protein